MNLGIRRKAPERELLDDHRRGRAMTWVMAIMLFLTVIAAALGLAVATAIGGLDRALSGQLTVQLVETDAAARDRGVAAVTQALRRTPGVEAVAPVDRARLAALLEPWLGTAGLDPDLPMPAMIDVTVRPDAVDAAARAVTAVAPGARVDRNAQWLAPVRDLLTTLGIVAGGLVLVIGVATTAVVLLAARAGLDTHRDTIEVLHMLGSTDVQIARLFQRRIAHDTLAGGLVGTAAAIALVWLIERQAATLGSEMIATAALGPRDWLLLAAIPAGFTLLATLAARFAVLRTLGRMP